MGENCTVDKSENLIKISCVTTMWKVGAETEPLLFGNVKSGINL